MKLQLPIPVEDFKNKAKLKVWERELHQNLRDLERTHKITIDMANEKSVNSFTKLIYAHIMKEFKKVKDTTADLMIKDIQSAHHNEYKLIKEKSKDETEVTIKPDNYDKFIEMEYGKNIPGVRLVQLKYGTN